MSIVVYAGNAGLIPATRMEKTAINKFRKNFRNRQF